MTERPLPAIPPEKVLDLLRGYLTRQDKLLEIIAEAERRRETRDQKILEVLQAIAGKPPAAPAAPPTIVLPPGTTELIERITREVTTQTISEIREVIREVIPKPIGAVRDYGSVTTTSSYVTVAKIKPRQGTKFKLTKIIVSCPEDVLCKLRWAGQDLGPEVYVMAKLPFTDWFPYGFKTKDGKDLTGDGSQLIELQVKYPSGGTAATCFGEISGDEEAA